MADGDEHDLMVQMVLGQTERGDESQEGEGKLEEEIGERGEVCSKLATRRHPWWFSGRGQ
jgi:hypothetical protein